MGSFKKTVISGGRRFLPRITFFAFFVVAIFLTPSRDGIPLASAAEGDAVKDCLAFTEGQCFVKLPLALQDRFENMQNGSASAETNCMGQYQMPVSRQSVEKIGAWAASADSGEKTKTFELVAYGLTFDVEVSKMREDRAADTQVFSIVRLRGREEIEKKLHENGTALNFHEGYLTPSKANTPKYTNDICPLLAPSDIQGLVWIVFPTSRGDDKCKEYRNAL